MTMSLSVQEARKLVLHSQKLPQAVTGGQAVDQTLASIEHLGYIQIDTISVIQRAHHHTLWNRNFRYKTNHLDQLLAEKKVFEYWSHAAAYLPMQEYRYTLPAKNALACGEKDHWYPRNHKLMAMVLDRIRREGPLQAKDFEYTGKKIAEWGSKPAKQALEYLFMQGDLMISKRINFHKVYDLTERVLPTDINLTCPQPMEQARFLVRRFLETNGLGQVSEVGYLRRGMKPILTEAVQQMISDGEIETVTVGSKHYLVLPESLALLEKPLRKQKLQILSPFDNLLIQRKRMQDLFDFNYQIECYVPAKKRQYGYFCLPLLWGGCLPARIDCKADRATGIFHIHSLHFEPWFKKQEALVKALEKQLPRFLAFNGCTKLKIATGVSVSY